MMNGRHGKVSRESGTVLLYGMLFTLPFLIFIGATVTDVASYYGQIKKAQHVADEAVFIGQKYLPYQEAATSAVLEYLRSKGYAPEGIDLEIEGDRVALTLEAPSTMTFARYFQRDAEYTHTVFASAQSKPIDAALIMDTSFYLGPDLFGEEAWGDERDWPTAQVFEDNIQIENTSAGKRVDPRIATQQCFNRLFSPLKRATLAIYDYLSAGELNAVGVSVYPGTAPFIRQIRPVKPQPQPGSPSDIDPAEYKSEEFRGSYCAAAASMELQHLSYRAPDSSNYIPKNWTPADGAGQIVDNQDYLFDDAYGPYMTMRDAIWSQAVSRHSGSVRDIFTNIKTQLYAAEIVETRARLKQSPTKLGIVIMGGLPRDRGYVYPDGDTGRIIVDEVTQLARLVEQYQLHTNIVLTFVDDVTKSSDYKTKVEILRQSIREVIGRESVKGYLEVAVRYAATPDDLMTIVAPYVAKASGTTLLTR